MPERTYVEHERLRVELLKGCYNHGLNYINKSSMYCVHCCSYTAATRLYIRTQYNNIIILFDYFTSRPDGLEFKPL